MHDELSGSRSLPIIPDPTAPNQVRRSTIPRAGSVSSNFANKQSIRKSPPTTRRNELEEALADLFPTNQSVATDQDVEERANERIVEENPLPSNSRRAVRPQTARARTLDLRQALLGEDTDDSSSSNREHPAQTVRGRTSTSKSIEKVPDPELAVIEPEAEITIEETDGKKEQIAESKALPQPEIVTRSPEPPISEVADPYGFDQDAEDMFVAEEKNLDVSERNVASNRVVESHQQPVIVSHVEGPRSIMVGREASYQVTLENTSDIRAKDLSAAVQVPEWVEVMDAMSTSGVVQRAESRTSGHLFEWRIHELEARSSESLRLRLIPRTGRPLHLGVKWTQAPVSTETLVEVQEPKLEMVFGGPQEVLFGKSQRYRLTLSNPGTGLTENVAIRLVPPGGDPQSASTQLVGDLEAGETKEIELELTTREAGELMMYASATAEGGLSAEAQKNVLCRKPELEVDWKGPTTKYSGTVAAYYFRVHNPGTAMTEPVEVNVQLPEGTQFAAASDGHLFNVDSGMVTWRLAGIAPEEEQFMQVRCEMVMPGENELMVTARTKNDELRATKFIQTNVVAVADLKLNVNDPKGPVPVGEEVTYEISVRNRGMTTAEGVNIVGLFSEGIDPTSVEGAQFSVRDGRVTFHTIKSLPASREILLKIRALAKVSGTHVFRAEVICQDLDIKLAAEESTKFFQDEQSWEDSKTPYSAEHSDGYSR